MKKTVAVVLALIAVFSSFISPAVFAAETRSYTVRYVPEKGEWRVQQRNSWDPSAESNNIDYLWGNIQDGDWVYIIGDEYSPAFGDLKIYKKLANLFIFAVTGGINIDSTQEISDVYVLKGTVATLSGIYETVRVYDDSSCNINCDVKKLLVSGETCMKMNINVSGKVDFCQIEDRGNVIDTIYNAGPGEIVFVDGVFQGSGNHNNTPDIPEPVPVPVGGQPEFSFWDKIISFLRRVWSFIVSALHIPDFSLRMFE